MAAPADQRGRPRTKEEAMAAQQATQDAWDRIAAGYDEVATPLATRLAEDALRLVEVGAGTRFLDVAAGSGALSIPAARLGAQVLATDISPVMIQRLRARARAEGLSNLEGRVMDGHALELEDDTFDVCGSVNGVSLFPDLARGLGELVRVCRPGGQVLLVAQGPPHKAEFLGFFLSAMRACVPGLTGSPMDPPPLPFQLADPKRLRQELSDAGLAEVRVQTSTWQMEFSSAAHLWDVVTNSNPIGQAMVANLTQAQRTEVQKVLDGMLGERSGGGPTAVLTTEVNVAIGVK
jgi:ubiquinone/menaquinone biosynthesis C-methylase UbiE